MEINFLCLNEINNEQLNFAVICAAYKGKWLFVRHKERNTWEVPGGHREEIEDINITAKRELYEETGALNYEIEPVCDYSVTSGNLTTYGRLFYANVTEIGPLPESEICEVRHMKVMPEHLTYPEIQPKLQEFILKHLAKKTLSLLEKDLNRNINIINFIKSYPVKTIDIFGESVLIRGTSDEEWVYISSRKKQEFLELVRGLDEEDKCFAILEDWMLPYIVKDKEIRSRLTSIKLVYEEGTPLPPVKSCVTDLPIAVAGYIFENSKYKAYLTVEYIMERIINGVALGIFENEKLVAWAITHDDGAIGFLNVLEGYRGKGFGTDVTVEMVNRLVKMVELPFVHIEEENLVSMNLALKAGFKKDRRIHWYKFM